ncbi:MAG: tetratricopeptide repeat protein [Pseudomonadota bacterium]
MAIINGETLDSPNDMDGAILEGSDQEFQTQVMQASLEHPVLVDFWAPWCGPCKQLGPMLERLVRAHKGRIRLVKINIDEHPMIAGQLQVQSIPAVFAFVGGRPVDGFMGAVGESQLKSFVERIMKAAGLDAVVTADELVEQADQLMAAQDFAQAKQVYLQAIELGDAPATAHLGLVSVLLREGNWQEAEDHLEAIGDMFGEDPAIAEAHRKLATAKESSGQAASLDHLFRASQANPDDLQTAFDYAIALFGAGQSQEAIDQLLALYQRDAGWNDGAVQQQLLKFFEALGFADPITVKSRRRLSALMFA